MGKSFLEKYSDNFLWKILSIWCKDKELMDEYKDFRNIFDCGDFCLRVVQLMKPLGIKIADDLDYEFAYKLIQLNFDKIQEGEFSGSLIRPEIKLYEFDVSEHSREYVSTIYRHRRYAYGISTIENILRSDNFYASEGREFHREVYDSDTTDTEIDDIRSIDKPKQNESYDQQSELKKLLSERQKIDHKIRKLLK